MLRLTQEFKMLTTSAMILILVCLGGVTVSSGAPPPLHVEGTAAAPAPNARAANTQSPTSNRSPAEDLGVRSWSCPTECTCHEAPLHAAPFVHTWLRNWPSEDMPVLGQNDVLDESAVAAAHGPAEDAGIDVTKFGLHATCALYPDANITHILQQLPSNIMALSVLQAAGSNYTIIEGDQLASLSNLKALSMLGFAPHPQKQNTDKNQDATEKQDVSENSAKDLSSKYLSMALADDALQPLINLEVLDLQYVRLVAKGDTQRSRRHTWGPVSTTTMVDMPLRRFLNYANNLDSVQLPRDLNTRDKNSILSNEIILNGKLFEEDRSIEDDGNISDENEDYELAEEVEVVLLNETENSEPVPYAVFDETNYDFFAPFMSQNLLKYLRIADAQLDRLGPELLGGLTNLHTFILEHNDIRVLPADVFAPTPSIRHLSMAHNSILSLDSRSLRGFPNLLTLDLEHNKITIIGSGSLPHLPKLRSIKLAGNPLKHILPESFLGINSTDTITIGSPEISTKVHTEAFRGLNNLKTLQINNISLGSFSHELFFGISQLEDLSLHGNISVIDYDAFTLVPKLKKLVISNCGLTEVSVDAFYGLSKVVILDMSFNNLQEITPGVFDHLSSLLELYLHNNQLTTLSVGIFAPLSLRVLRLNYNPWDCSCNLLQLHPSITNSILQKSYTICNQGGKGDINCNAVTRRVIYDSRIAPTCMTPPHFKNKDVYTVADKFLKCSKYHWDPLSYTERPRISQNRYKKKKKNKILTTETSILNNFIDVSNDLLQADEGEHSSFEMNWKPLSSYTPIPIKPLDLLSLAESDMFEEAVEEEESETTTPRPRIMRTEVILQDASAPLTKEEHKRRILESRAQYLANKKKIKHRMQMERVREVQRLIKKDVWKHKKIY